MGNGSLGHAGNNLPRFGSERRHENSNPVEFHTKHSHNLPLNRMDGNKQEESLSARRRSHHKQRKRPKSHRAITSRANEIQSCHQELSQRWLLSLATINKACTETRSMVTVDGDICTTVRTGRLCHSLNRTKRNIQIRVHLLIPIALR